MPVTSAQGIIGTENYPDAGIFLNYEEDDCSQVYAQIKEDFGALTKDDIILLFLFDHDFKISHIRADDVGYIFYVFDIQYQQTFTVSNQLN